jgi:hypothetical protein
MLLLLSILAGFILGLKVGITIGHRTARRAEVQLAAGVLYPKGDEPRVER